MALTALVAYDIADDGRRARLAAYLQSWGDRVQRSVFLCTLPDDDAPQVLDAVREIVNPEVDGVLVLRQCGSCRERMVSIGQTTPPDAPLWWSAL